jgi:uncharacterized protein (TIGR02271 family)
MTEHIVATFSTQQAADEAARELENAGFPASAIRQYQAGNKGEGGRTSYEITTESTASDGGGFWAWLLGEEGPQTRTANPRDDEWYNRRTGAGDTVLSVAVTDDSRIHQATTILDSHHPVEMEETTDEENVGALSGDRMVASPSPGIGSVDTSDRLSQTAARGAEEVIPLAEENLEIGKRTVDRGTTRVRRYVVEKPVERDVTLHGERVTIERRTPVESSVPGHAFEERTVEVRETEEVPVVAKTARVVEEVAIRKEATERTETVRDTVRREEVEVTPPTAR